MEQTTSVETAFVKSLGISAKEEKPEDFSRGVHQRGVLTLKPEMAPALSCFQTGEVANVRQLGFWET